VEEVSWAMLLVAGRLCKDYMGMAGYDTGIDSFQGWFYTRQ
jgi:hypothetical protein